MSSNKLRRKGVVSSGDSSTNSLDWDSPSTITGTVKRRPISSDCSDLTVTEITVHDNAKLNKKKSFNHTKIPLNLKNSTNTLEKQFYSRASMQISKVDSQKSKNNSTKTSTNRAKSTLIPSKINLNSLKPSVKSNIDKDIEKRFLLETTSESYTYLIERKTWKTGKVSDSDSGIASPLSPSSLYGFPVCYDKDECYEKDKVTEERIKKQSISYFTHHIQVR